MRGRWDEMKCESAECQLALVVEENPVAHFPPSTQSCCLHYLEEGMNV